MVLETRDITADIHSSNPAVFQVGGLGVCFAFLTTSISDSVLSISDI